MRSRVILKLLCTAVAAGAVLTGCTTTPPNDRQVDRRPIIVAAPNQPGTAMLVFTVGVDGVSRNCRIVRSSGDASDDARACRFFTRPGHEIRTDEDGRPVEYERKVGVTPPALKQLREAFP